MFVIAGLVLVASAALVPATYDLWVMRTQLRHLDAQERENFSRLEAYSKFVTDLDSAEPQLVVPRDALTDVGGKSVVFIRAADGDFVLHEVTVGESAMDDVQVLSGVSEGEAVVVSGVFTLKSLLLKSTLAEDE